MPTCRDLMLDAGELETDDLLLEPGVDGLSLVLMAYCLSLVLMAYV